MAGLDLSADFDAALLASFYAGAGVGFLLGFFGARLLFGRPWEDLCRHRVLLPVSPTRCCWACRSPERAYGSGALAGNYAIIRAASLVLAMASVIHAMELLRARGAPLRHLPGRCARRAFLSNVAHHFGILGRPRGEPFRAADAWRTDEGVRLDGPRRPACGALRLRRRALPLPARGDLRTHRLCLRRVGWWAPPGDHLRSSAGPRGLDDGRLALAPVLTAVHAAGGEHLPVRQRLRAGPARRGASSVLIGTAVTVRHRQPVGSSRCPDAPCTSLPWRAASP